MRLGSEKNLDDISSNISISFQRTIYGENSKSKNIQLNAAESTLTFEPTDKIYLKICIK